MTTSIARRAQIRGAMAEAVFLAEMDRLGFVLADPPRPGFLWEWTHPDTGARRYIMRQGESYATRLGTLRDELEAGRIHHREMSL